MGEIVDRTLEHLAPSYRMIAITRRRLIDAAQKLAKQGKSPATVDNPDICRRARGGAFIAPTSIDWLDAYFQKLQEADSPLGPLDRNVPLAAE
jgi:phthalate 4,5-dioxygenase